MRLECMLVHVPERADKFAAGVRGEGDNGWVSRVLDIKGKGRMHAYLLMLEPAAGM